MKNYSVLYALLAAVLFGINAPFSKLLINELNPLFLAALLYLGAGIGMTAITFFNKSRKFVTKEARLTKEEIPYIILMILLDIAAPIFLLFGISMSNASTAALLGTFEIAATAVIAMIIFKEAIGKRLWIAIGFISLASILLTVTDAASIRLSIGSILILCSCVCWGFENNCTRKISIKDPLQIVILKGFGWDLGHLLLQSFGAKYQGHWLRLLRPCFWVLLPTVSVFISM